MTTANVWVARAVRVVHVWTTAASARDASVVSRACARPIKASVAVVNTASAEESAKMHSTSATAVRYVKVASVLTTIPYAWGARSATAACARMTTPSVPDARSVMAVLVRTMMASAWGVRSARRLCAWTTTASATPPPAKHVSEVRARFARAMPASNAAPMAYAVRDVQSRTILKRVQARTFRACVPFRMTPVLVWDTRGQSTILATRS